MRPALIAGGVPPARRCLLLNAFRIIRRFFAVDRVFRSLLGRRADGSAGKSRAAHGEYGGCGDGHGELTKLLLGHVDTPLDLHNDRL